MLTANLNIISEFRVVVFLQDDTFVIVGGYNDSDEEYLATIWEYGPEDGRW